MLNFYMFNVLLGMKKFYQLIVKSSTSSTSTSASVNCITAQKRSRVEFDPNDIVTDPGLQKEIADYDVKIRDQVRRESNSMPMLTEESQFSLNSTRTR